LKISLHSEGAELVAGTQRWIEELNKMGWITTDHLDPTNSTSLEYPKIWSELKRNITAGSYSSIHSILPIGLAAEISPFMAELTTALQDHMGKGGLASIENPMTTNLWNHGWFKTLVATNDMHYSVTDKCQWGLGSQQRTRLCSNVPKKFLQPIERARCKCAKPHSQLTSRYNFTKNNGWVSSSSTEDLPHFTAALAGAHHQAWMNYLLKTGSTALKIANIATAGKTDARFNTIDSAAEKLMLRVGPGGNWKETEILGPIRCEGFDKSSAIYNLSKAMTVATTTTGQQLLLIAEQAVTHEDPNMSSLVDPSAPAASSWKVNMNFTKSSGTLEYGNIVIELQPQGAGIGFFSRKPTAKEMNELERIPISRTGYDKKKFLAEGEKQDRHGFGIQQFTSRKGTEFTKSKFTNTGMICYSLIHVLNWHDLLLVDTRFILA
jgi:hypothetical protein